jgi:hypothetical protein
MLLGKERHDDFNVAGYGVSAKIGLNFTFFKHFFIQTELKQKGEVTYGKQILVTLSQQLTERLGKGFSYSALTRMVKVAQCFDEKNIATLSQQLSWSHFIELAGVENETKRLFYTQFAINHQWNIRVLRKEIDALLFERTAIATKPENIISESPEIEISIQSDSFASNQISLLFIFASFSASFLASNSEAALITNPECLSTSCINFAVTK